MNLLGFLLALSLACQVASFTPISPRSTSMARLASVRMAKIAGDDEDFQKPEEYTGETDWDAEWKKVVENQNQPTVRPGKDFYKSDVEISAIRAANTATERVVDVAKELPSLPTWDTLKGDWKFWIGLIAAISIGSSLLAAMGTQQIPANSSPDSYYI